MMKLYDCQMAPNPRRARIFIAEKGLDIPNHEVSIMAGENLQDSYLKINPWGALPALELDDGTVIVESPSIFRYLETIHPEPNLLGNDPIETAHINSWERFAELNGAGAVGEFFRNKTEAFKDRALVGYTGISTIPELSERGRQRAAWFYKQIDQRLGESEYLGSDRFTAADITALCAVDFGKAVGLAIPDDCVNVARWHAVVAARPGTHV
jgi:glutathione S-transferase